MAKAMPDIPNWAMPALVVGLGLGVAYALYSILDGLFDKGKETVDDTAQKIADTYVKWTTDEYHVNARIVMPNGQVIPFDGIALVHEGAGRMTFMLGGRKYVLAPRRSDGLYPATLA